MDWHKVIIFIIGIAMGMWVADTPRPTYSSCLPVCVELWKGGNYGHQEVRLEQNAYAW